MDLESCGVSPEEKLIYFIDRNDINNVERLLKEGANATVITSIGRSAIGYSTLKGLSNILRLLLWSCEDNFNIDDNECSEPKKLKPSKDRTPDGMEDLQWEEEIQDDFTKYDANDEWSKLYVYYARIFEKTGELLSNTIKKKDPHCLDSYSHAPLHYAAMTGNLQCAELLLQYNSPVDITTKCGYTALHLAVKSPDVARCLLKRRANPNKYADHKQETPLHTAVRIGTPEVIEMLIDAGADINATCLMNRTPLILAIASKKFEIANILIDRGAKLNTQDSQGWTPLYVAVFVQNVDIVERLLKLGARLFVNHYLLHYCVREDLLDMIKVLVKYGDNIDIRNQSGWSPLLISISERNIPIFQFFIDNGAKLNDNPLLKELHVAIMYCTQAEEFKAIAQTLIHRNVDVNSVNYWGETPLHYTILQEKYEMTEYLIKEGADVNVGHIARSTDNLILARHSKNVDLMKLLVYAGLKIHSTFRPKALQPPPWNDKDSEQFLAKISSNTLSLQQLTRITIRNKLIEKLKETSNAHQSFNHLNSDASTMKYLVSLLHLPKSVQNYLFDFPDVPHLKNSSNPTISSISSYEIQSSNLITMPKTVLVTGAAQGIGRSIAIRLAKDGFNVAVNDLNGNFVELNNVRKEIEEMGRKSIVVFADVSIEKDVESMMKSVAIQMGSLDVVIANAGIAQVKPFLEITLDDWDNMFAVNARGVFLCYREAAKVMIEQGNGGKIIGACSIVGHRSFPMLSHYSATKWSVRGLTQAAAMELAKYNITVNAYCPGIVDTAMWDTIDQSLAKYNNKEKGENIKEYSERLVALGRTSVPDDVANFVSYLASKDSDYMTGQSVIIDGGIQFS